MAIPVVREQVALIIPASTAMNRGLKPSDMTVCFVVLVVSKLLTS